MGEILADGAGSAGITAFYVPGRRSSGLTLCHAERCPSDRSGFGLKQGTMLDRIPALVAAVCLTIYWGYVPIKGYRLRRKFGKGFNAMPKETVGRAMRIM